MISLQNTSFKSRHGSALRCIDIIRRINNIANRVLSPRKRVLAHYNDMKTANFFLYQEMGLRTPLLQQSAYEIRYINLKKSFISTAEKVFVL